MSKNKENYIPEVIKIILVGYCGVGKTSIINRFYCRKFEDCMTTVAMNFVEKKIDICGKTLTLKIWDTAGQEKFRSCNKLFIKNSNIVVFVYSITSKESFEDLNYWYETIQKELGEKPLLSIVGNKVDLIDNEEVSEDEGKELANKWDAFYGQLSAKCDQKGIDIFFEKLLNLFLEKKRGIYLRNDSITINIDNRENTKKGCCLGKPNKANQEIDINIIFFGEKDESNNIKSIIKTIIGNGKTTQININENININKYQYKYKSNKKIINANFFEMNEECINSDEIKLDSIIQNCKIFYLVFDMNKRENFNDLNKYIETINKCKEGKNFINILGVTDSRTSKTHKADNESVTNEEAIKFSNDFGGNFKEVSINDKNILQSLLKTNIDNYLNY